MKAVIKGRALGVNLAGDQPHIAAQLESKGLQGKHVQAIATVAVRFAQEETVSLERQFVPPAMWPGTVVCRRHHAPEGSAWLMLKRGKKGWTLDAALFE
jgi:hypothetical protein